MTAKKLVFFSCFSMAKDACIHRGRVYGYWLGFKKQGEKIIQEAWTVLLNFKEPGNRFQGIDSAILCSLSDLSLSISKRLWSPGIDSEESISPAYVAWRASTTNRVFVPARQAGNRYMGSFKGLQIRALYDNPIPTGFLGPTDCSKILAQYTKQERNERT